LKDDDTDWKAHFKKVFNKFIDDITDAKIKILCDELSEDHSVSLKNCVTSMTLFYRSFVGNDPVKDIDLEKLFQLVKSVELDGGHNFIAANFKIKEDAGHVIGREGEIYRAFINLVHNSVDAILNERDKIGYPEAFGIECRIGVNVYFDNGFSVIEISDNGPGMLKEALEAFRNHTVYSSKGELGGRGLKSARDIIERNGGTIDIKSEEGKGATVIVRLPAAQKMPPTVNDVLEGMNSLKAVSAAN
jgi:signal transduction histidine kinase